MSFDQSTCGIEYGLHENLASILSNDVGIRMINEMRQNFLNMCLDPVSHNALITMMNVVLDVTTDPNLSKTVGNTFYWIKKIIKDDRFKIIWHDTMKGVNLLFDDPETINELSNTMFDNMEALLTDPTFDYTLDKMMKSARSMINLRKNLMNKAGSLLTKPMNVIQRSNSKNGYNRY